MLCILFDGLKNLHLNLSFPLALFYSVTTGLFFAILSAVLVRRIRSSGAEISGYQNSQQVIGLEKAMKHLQRVKLSSKEVTNKKVSEILRDVKTLSKEVRDQTQFQESTSPFTAVERIFVFLQIISASLVAFAHGANDVANAIGPVGAVVEVLHTKVISSHPQIPYWLLIMGGAGIVLGLATWGWRVIETIGRKITELTPTRGFCAEFGAATTILFASKLGLPISTTHSLVGAVLGVGLARGLQALNLKTLRDIVLSWIVTIPICAVFSIIVFYILKAIFI